MELISDFESETRQLTGGWGVGLRNYLDQCEGSFLLCGLWAFSYMNKKVPFFCLGEQGLSYRVLYPLWKQVRLSLKSPIRLRMILGGGG